MSKEKFLEILEKELERLEEVEHVSDLANNWRCSEVDAIVAEIDYSALEEYMEECDGVGDLEVSEIPGGRYLTFVIYLSGSDYDECDVMENWEDLQYALRDCGEAGNAIADTLIYDAVNAFDTFEDLLNGGEEDDDADEDECDDDADECAEEDEEAADEGSGE